MSRVKKNFLYNTTYQLVRILTPLLTVPYLSRVLGPDNVGVYSYTYSITYYFILFAGLGMSTYGVRAIATAGDNREKRSRVFWSTYVSQLTITGGVLIAYALYCCTFAQGGLFICLLWSVWVISTAFDVTWLMFGVEDFKATALRSTVVKIVEVVLIFLLVKTDGDLWVYIAIVSFGLFVSQIVLWPFIPRYVDFVRPTWQEVRIHYAPNLRLFIPVVAISLYTAMDKVLLGSLSTMEQTGFFEYSEKVSKIPMALIMALGTVMLPRMSAVFSSGDEERGKNLIETSMWLMQAGAFAMALGVISISPELAPVFLGERFADCALIMAILASVIPLISGSNVIGKQYLIPQYRDNQYTATVVCGAVMDIVTILALVPAYGALGAAIATVAAEGTVLLTQAWIVHRDLPLGRYALNALPFAICGLVMALVVRISAAYFNSLWGMTVLGLLYEVLIGAIVFVVLALGFCLTTKNKYFYQLLGGRLQQ